MASNRGNIVFVVTAAMSERDAKRFGIHWLVLQGFDVTVLDTTPIVFPRKVERRANDGAFTTFTVRTATTIERWREELSALSAADVIFCMASDGSYQADIVAVLRLISRSKTPYVVFRNNIFPQPAATFDVHLWWARLCRFNPMNSLVARLPPVVLGLRPADFVVLGGRGSVGPTLLVGPTTRAINAHAFDYDVYLESRDQRDEKSIAVYIDQHLGFQSDAAALGVRQLVDPDVFYPQLETLFTRVEAEFGVEVVIAAHPRMDPARRPEWYAHRKVFHDKTAALVAEAKLVILCHSTAINWAILFEKPVLQYASRSIVSHPFLHGMIEKISEEIGSVVVFVDDFAAGDLTDAAGLDTNRYTRYRAEFIKQPGTADRYSWDLIVEALVGCGTLKGQTANGDLSSDARPVSGDGDRQPAGNESACRTIETNADERRPDIGRTRLQVS